MNVTPRSVSLIGDSEDYLKWNEFPEIEVKSGDMMIIIAHLSRKDNTIMYLENDGGWNEEAYVFTSDKVTQITVWSNVATADGEVPAKVRTLFNGLVSATCVVIPGISAIGVKESLTESDNTSTTLIYPTIDVQDNTITLFAGGTDLNDFTTFPNMQKITDNPEYQVGYHYNAIGGTIGGFTSERGIKDEYVSLAIELIKSTTDEPFYSSPYNPVRFVALSDFQYIVNTIKDAGNTLHGPATTYTMTDGVVSSALLEGRCYYVSASTDAAIPIGYYQATVSSTTPLFREANGLDGLSAERYADNVDKTPGTGVCTIQDVGIINHDDSVATNALTYHNMNEIGYVKELTITDFTDRIMKISFNKSSSRIEKAYAVVVDGAGNYAIFETYDGSLISTQTLFLDPSALDQRYSYNGTLDVSDLKYIGLFSRHEYAKNRIFSMRYMTVDILDPVIHNNIDFSNIDSINPLILEKSGVLGYTLRGDVTFTGDINKSVTTLGYPMRDKMYITDDNNTVLTITNTNGKLGKTIITSDAILNVIKTNNTIDMSASILKKILIDVVEPLIGVSVSECPQVNVDADITNCNISDSLDTCPVNWISGKILGGSIKSSDYAIEIGSAGDYEIMDTDIVSTNETFNVTAATGDVNITTNISDVDYVTAGATVTIITPIVYTGLSFTGLVPNTQIIIFETGTQTEITSVETSGTSFDWNPIYSVDQIVDYTIYHEGYSYIRATAVLCSDTIKTIGIQQSVDRPYVASTGLTYGTSLTVGHFFYDRVTKKFSIKTDTSIQNFYAAMKEAFRDELSLRNTQFSIFPNGQSSFSFEDGISFNNDDDIRHFHSDGFRFVDSLGIRSIFSAVTSGDGMDGLQAEYIQTDGDTAVKKTYTTGAIRQCFHTYQRASTSTTIIFDYRSFLVIKCQANGYESVEVNVNYTYGELADEHYIISLAPKRLDMVIGDPGISDVEIIDHGASPVTWNVGNGDKEYSITIIDSGVNSAEDIHRWINYHCSLDAEFQGKEPFQWHDMIEGGSSGNHTTIRHNVYGDIGAALKGVRVLRGSDPHPDFPQFQADDGTYGIQPIVNNCSITDIENNSRVRIYNVTKATEVFNGIVTGGSYTDIYSEGGAYSTGDSINIRVTYQNGLHAKLEWSTNIQASSSGWGVSVNQQDDVYYNLFALDGSTITKFTADYTNDEVDLVVSGGFTLTEIYAWWVYNNTTAQGIAEFFGGLSAEDAGNFVINNSVVSIFLDNTTNTDIQGTDNRRLRRTDGQMPVRVPTSGGGAVYIEWRNKVIPFASGSSMTTEEHNKLMSIPNSTAIATAVLDEVT